MSMAVRFASLRPGRAGMVGLAVLALGAALGGCQAIDEATGAAKIIPDEFAVVTKAPLVVPPDFNLRPPKPGAPDANASTPSEDAQQALFPNDPEAAANALGPSYSAAEKNLLAKSGGSNVDPGIRRELSSETGFDTDPALNAKLLPGQATAASTAPGTTASSDQPSPTPAASQ